MCNRVIRNSSKSQNIFGYHKIAFISVSSSRMTVLPSKGSEMSLNGLNTMTVVANSQVFALKRCR